MTFPMSFSHYTVTEKIGAGGMGEVFRATDSKLGRDVALKMLPEMLAEDPERLARFQREAQVLAALNHPGIAAIYGLETQGDRHALAMELVTGPDLSERLEAGPILLEEGLSLALQLAEALEAAHEKGIIHRDLKPANIKLTGEGKVKILDFGLAKALAEDPGSSSGVNPAFSPTLTANMTAGNVILGTAAYMSPEQARGHEVDKRTDIWAFGVVVAEMLGGKRLFHGETVTDTLASVLKSAIELDELPAGLPPAVLRLLKRCLQRDPRQRLRDMGDARIVLQEVLGGSEEGPEPRIAVKGNPWPLRAALLVAAAAAAVAGFAFLRPDAPVRELPLRKFEIPLNQDDGSAVGHFSPVISPDGRFLLYLSGGMIQVRDLATTVSRALPGTEGALVAFWSPDSEWIGFGTSEAMMKIDRSGGRSMILANVGGATSMGTSSTGIWGPDGSILYTTASTGVLHVSAQAGEVTMAYPVADGEVDYHQCCALPGGRGLVVVVHGKHGYGQLNLLTGSGQGREIYSYPGDSFGGLAWSPSGHLLFTRTEVAKGIWALPFSLDDLTVTGEPFLVAVDGLSPTVSSDGTLVYSAGVVRKMLELAWFDRQGAQLQVLAELQTGRPFPSLSSDQKKILICATAEKGRAIWQYDAETGAERRLTFDELDWSVPAWHPDGVHFLSYTEPDYETFLFTLDGSEPRRSLGPGILGIFSNQGDEVFLSVPKMDAGFDFNIAVLSLDQAADEPRSLVATPALEWGAAPSPDGKYFLYVSDESGKQEIYVTTYPGQTGRWQVSRGGGGWAVWRSDGREIFYTTMREIFSVSVEDRGGVVFGKPVKLFDRQATGWSTVWPDGFAVSDDGQRFLMLNPKRDDTQAPPSLVVVQNWIKEFE